MFKINENSFFNFTLLEEKKSTVSELANQKGILQQANGWKIYHLTAQMDEVVS